MQLIAMLALATQVAAAPATSPAPATTHAAELRGEELMDSLRAGGYTILLRHARTDRSFREEMGTVPVERSAQRNLTAEGERDAQLMRLVLEKYRIPIGEIVSSPMFRARETAELAAGTPAVTMALRAWPTTNEQAALVAATPAPGTNRLLVTHHFVIEKHVPGIRPGDIGESEAAVVQPSGDGGVTLIGRITLGDWEKLAGVAQSAAQAPAPSHPTGSYAPFAGSAAPVALPSTPAGLLARRYLHVFNSGDPAVMRGFIESSLVADPRRPTDARVRTFVETFTRTGPMTATGIRSSADDEIVVVARGREGDYLITVRTATPDSGRAASISIAFGTSQGHHP